MHDAVENSALTVEDVKTGFGTEVGELVAALTEDRTIPEWEARKDALRAQVAAAGETAAMIYAADKLSNLQEMRRIYAIHGEDAIDFHKAPTLDLRVAAWVRDLEMLRAVGADPELLDALARELAGFECERVALRA